MRASALYALGALCVAFACAHDTPADPAPARQRQPELNTSRCFEEAGTSCGAGNLPRIAAGAWSEQQVREFMERFRAGTAAVELALGQAKLVAQCKLDGSYTEVNGKNDSARFWATNRLLLLPSEIGQGCDDATHVVAAFVTRGKTFSAILVPLPCPPVSETTPAKRCVGEGAVGTERSERVKAAIKALPSDKRWQQDPGFVLANHALAPDYWLGLELLQRISSECAVREQAKWLVSRYTFTRDATGERTAALAAERLPPNEPAPSIDEEKSWHSCMYQPAFRKCFPGVFEASPGSMGCWERAKKEITPK